MQKQYKPDLGGFANKLGIKNGIDELLLRPVPKQEIFHYYSNDINSVKTQQSEYSGGKKRSYYRKRR